MKKLLFILMFIPMGLFGQGDRYSLNTDTIPYTLQKVEQFSPQDTVNHNTNVLYWSVNLAQLSFVGVRYDKFFGPVGIYGAYNKQRHTGGDDIINIQDRYAIGCVWRLQYRRDEIDSPIASLGVVYHDWRTEDYVEGQINPERAFRKVSLEVGLGGRIKRVNVSARIDTQIEFCIDLGFNF